MAETLKFGAVEREPDIRHAADMKELIIDKNWFKRNKEAELYYMYRDLWKEGDRERILENDLRFDVTIIPPLQLGRELVKTAGHYHPEAAPGVSYTEIYGVLEGIAHYLLQKRTARGIEDVVLVEARPGDMALIPPNYGHITINPGDEPLKMANWVNREFESVYGDYKELGGGAYFELLDRKFEENPNYRHVPELRRVGPSAVPELGIESGNDFYELIRKPENLLFLKQPQNYDWVFERVL